ncbi:WD40 domain-containing protein [Spraguea lophii 42_110]|uniref:Serine-threonine kinase receptor-associated protein n=1 Tax=Spraguea lophii (strain 42_110) TaxID=1358809 RepID=S7W9J8_SPRLO|nr:WD40 domain-containing protein [Spraguea lophii 42_110]
MITNIEFLEEGIECKKLEKYILTEEDKKLFPGYTFKNLDEEPMEDSEDDENERIYKEDILFSTIVNLEEASYIDIIAGNRESTEYFIHHEIQLSDLIYDSVYLKKEKQYIGVATSSPDVEIYDALLFNPLVPQIKLLGHEDEVNTITYDGTDIMTGSNDKTIIQWDLEKKKPKEKYEMGVEVNYLESNENILGGILGNNEIFLRNGNDTLKTKFESEPQKLKFYNDKLLASDEDGFFYVYDLRMFDSPLIKKGLHRKCITAFDVANQCLITASTDESLKLWNYETLELQKKIQTGEPMFSVKFCPYVENYCAYGGKDLRVINMLQ